MEMKWIITALMLFVCLMATAYAQDTSTVKSQAGDTPGKDDTLIIVWTSADKEVATHMVFMYAFNYKGPDRWKNITLIVWGPSAKLVSKDEEIQTRLAGLMKKGVIVKACQACSDIFGVTEKLTELGVNVKYMGRELTDYIKNGNHILTF